MPHGAVHSAGNAGRYRDQLNHWYCKYWWAAMLAEAGYTVCFLDNDAVVLGDPFQGIQPLRCNLSAASMPRLGLI